MSIVVCKLPKAGLGNQLFPLMKAVVFARLNNLPLMITHYNRLKIGPYLRREKSKRKYTGYFNFQKSIIGEQFDKWKLLTFKNHRQENEPEIKPVDTKKNVKYFFTAMPNWENYFGQLKENRELVIELFWKMISARFIAVLSKHRAPVIGVHIRMGDFRKLQEGEDFSQVGTVRTPEKYFIDVISRIRNIHGTSLPVSVFTDGYKHEFEELFKLENVQLIEGNADIIDLMLLSKSRIIVTSAGSTFSYWAGFLSSAPLIMHPDHIHQPIRPDDVAEKIYEGPFTESSGILIDNIKAIH